MSVVRGRDLMLFRRTGESPSYTYEALGAATTHTMNLSREELDTSNKDTGEFGDTELGQISWDIQADSMMIQQKPGTRQVSRKVDGLLELEDMKATYVSLLSQLMQHIMIRRLIVQHSRGKDR